MASDLPEKPRRVVHTRGYLRVAARELMRNAQRDEHSISSAIMASVASAFYLEAALNHVGDLVYKH